MTSPDCDLRGMQFMPLDIVRLFDSDFYAISTGDEFKAGLTLWGRSFLQVPAGSLPNDERILAHLSGAARNWPKVRDVAMRGWTLCSDGRWYHVVVAEKANEAWTRRSAYKERTRAATDARRRRNEQRNVGDDGDVTTDVTATKGQGQRKEAAKPLVSGSSRAPDPLKTGMADLETVDGHPTCNGYHVDVVFEACCEAAGMRTVASVATWQPVIDWLSEGYQSGAILGVIRKMAERSDYKPPRTLAYFTKAIHDERPTMAPLRQA